MTHPLTKICLTTATNLEKKKSELFKIIKCYIDTKDNTLCRH